MNPYSDSMNNRRFQHNPAWWLLLLKNQLINETEKSLTHFTIRTCLCSILLLEFQFWEILLFQEQLGSGLSQNVGSTAPWYSLLPQMTDTCTINELNPLTNYAFATWSIAILLNQWLGNKLVVSIRSIEEGEIIYQT